MLGEIVEGLEHIGGPSSAAGSRGRLYSSARQLVIDLGPWTIIFFGRKKPYMSADRRQAARLPSTTLPLTMASALSGQV